MGEGKKPRLLAQGAGSECTPVEEMKPERVLSEDRERGTSEGKAPALNSKEFLLGCTVWSMKLGPVGKPLERLPEALYVLGSH